MKTRVEKGLWRLELGLVCAVAPKASECRGTVGALAPAVLAVGFVDSRGCPWRSIRLAAFFGARFEASSRTVESGASAKTAIAARATPSAPRKKRPRLRGPLGAGSSRFFLAASSSDRASAAKESRALVSPTSFLGEEGRLGEDGVSPGGGSRSRASRASSGSTSASSGVRGSTRSILAHNVVAQGRVRSTPGPAG
jgi:hypothetical protein